MHVKIDWLSFTVPVRSGIENIDGFALAIEHGFYEMFGSHVVAEIFGGEWRQKTGSRAPYSLAYDVQERGITVYCNPSLNTALVEISGRGCDFVRQTGLMKGMLEMAQNRLTRVDIACDMETGVKPVEFAPKAQFASTTTYSEMNSRTGQTVYIGSMKSETYTRVYRYAKPHPRAALLRVEFVFRRKLAKKIAEEILVQGLDAVAEASGRRVKFTHPVWKPKDTAEKFTLYGEPERENKSTFFWLVNAAAPAFRRLVKEGVIVDPEAFLAQHFMIED